MNRTFVRTGLMSAACVLSLAACASEETMMKAASGGGAPASSGAAMSSGSAAVTGGASQAVADSLNACLARLPKDSSAGAKMVAEQTCRDNEALRQGIVGTATTKSGDRASAGTQGDSLEACMSRIPKDATAGQRMLAEESCKRDQTTHR